MSPPDASHPGADPGFRRGGVRTFRRGGGVRTGISGADPNCCRVLGKSTSKKKLQTAVGGVSDHPKKTPVSAHVTRCCSQEATNGKDIDPRGRPRTNNCRREDGL